MMKDLIDERNERERIQKSIIKYWNVNYVPQRNEKIQSEKEECEQEVEYIVEEEHGLYNESTHALSGAYGHGEVEDEVTKGQIDKILREKRDAIQALFDEDDAKL